MWGYLRRKNKKIRTYAQKLNKIIINARMNWMNEAAWKESYSPKTIWDRFESNVFINIHCEIEMSTGAAISSVHSSAQNANSEEALSFYGSSQHCFKLNKNKWPLSTVQNFKALALFLCTLFLFLSVCWSMTSNNGHFIDHWLN